MADPISPTDFLNRIPVPRISESSPPVQKDLIAEILKADDAIFGSGIENRACVRALLILQAGDLDRSHKIVQEMPGKSAAYVHGMLHRIEGDYSNAKYWFRRATNHPAFSRGSVDPIDLTDQLARSVRSAVPQDLTQSLRIELNSLLDFLMKT
jgi:hypothetical protein